MSLRFPRPFPVPAVALALVLAAPGAARSQDAAATALTTGEYANAVRLYRARARGRDATVEGVQGYVRALMATGRYDDAEEAARAGVERLGDGLQGTLGRTLIVQGRVDEAAAAFQAADRAGAPDAASARLDLALLEERRGRLERARALYDGFIDLYNGGGARTSADLQAVGVAVWKLGKSNPDLFKDALRALDEAVAADPANQDARVLLGRLFLEKYNGPDARASFEEVLRENPNHADALVGLAATLRFDGQPGSREVVDQALEVNPDHVPARVLLAELHLSAERHDEARAQAERALEVDPASLEALSVLAASYALSDEPEEFGRVRDRALGLNPHHADLYNAVADLSVDHRRYAQAVEMAGRALELDPDSWRALGIRGINLLRLGDVEGSRDALERAFAGDPYNVWLKNTLDLLDTYDRYVTVETEHFRIFLRQDEAAVLAPYATALAEEAWDSLTARYRYEPPQPVRLELYPSHADFSVRTAGLAGIGILGVSFGSVLAMDSPSARDLGSFNWGSTLWHELAHAFHLGMTEHRVPRWFSEGLAVHEQRRARDGWGHQPDVGYLRAWDEGRMPPVSRMNEGFVRPSFPEQVVFSYFQASLVFDLIETEFGFQAVLDMLHGYREGLTTEALIPQVLDMSPRELDRRFEAYMDARYGATLAAIRPRPGEGDPSLDLEALERRVEADSTDFLSRFRLGRAMAGDERWEEAVPQLEAARALFPEFGAADGPSWVLARAYEELEKPDAAADAYHQAARVNESHYHAGLEEARLRQQQGDVEGAAAALDRSIWVYPYELDVHRQLAELMADAGRWPEVIRERAAVVALDPADRAEALYQLALSHYRAGDGAEARRHVLRALEVAPTYEEALELLLQLREGGSGPGAGP